MKSSRSARFVSVEKMVSIAILDLAAVLSLITDGGVRAALIVVGSLAAANLLTRSLSAAVEARRDGEWWPVVLGEAQPLGGTILLVGILYRAVMPPWLSLVVSVLGLAVVVAEGVAISKRGTPRVR